MGKSAVVGLFLFFTTIVSANAQSNSSANPGRPGTLNYVEGQVSIGSGAVDPKSVGSVQLEAGQSVSTEQGKAEILLTPGAFLRLGANTSVNTISLGLTNTEVQVERGHAIVEVAEIYHENNLRGDLNKSTTRIVEKGLYDFDAARNELRVLDGKASVQENGVPVEVKSGHELALNSAGSLKAEKFDKKTYEDDLYNWSSLRSRYLAEANTDAAQIYQVGGSGWLGTGWYWDPWYDAYTFIPGDGIFYSPFGWGFFSPGLAFGSPFFVVGHFHHDFDRDFRGRGFFDRGLRGRGVVQSGGFHGGFPHRGGGFPHRGGGFPAGGGVRGGGFHGGGFHGGRFHGGGFHGGGFHGGGRH